MKARQMVALACVALSMLLANLSMTAPTQAQSRQLKQIGTGTAFAAAWSPDGSELSIGSSQGIWLYSPVLKLLGHFEGNEQEITMLAWNPNGKQIASVSQTGEIQLWDATNGKAQSLETTTPDPPDPGSLSYSPDGSRLASAIAKNNVHVWDTASAKLVQTLNTDGPAFAVAWAPNGKQIAAGGAQSNADDAPGFLLLWDATTGKVVKTFTPDDIVHGGQTCTQSRPLPPVTVVRWAGHDLFALVEGVPAGTFAWDVETDQPAKPLVWGGLEPCAYGLADLAFSADGNVRAADIRMPDAPVIDMVEFADGSANYLLHSIDLRHAAAQALAWRSDNHTLAVVGEDGLISLFDIQRDTKDYDESTGLKPATILTDFLPFEVDRPADIAWSQDGQQLLYTAFRVQPYSNMSNQLISIQVIDLLTGTIIRTVPFPDQPTGPISGGVISPNGKWLVADNPGEGTPPTIYDLKTGQPVATGQGMADWQSFDPTSVSGGSQGQATGGLDWSPDSKTIAVIVPTRDNAVLAVWDPAANNVVASQSLPDNIDCCTMWSPTGNDIALHDITTDKAFYVFDLKTAQLVVSFDGDSSLKPTSVVWNPLGRSVAMVSSDQTIRLWNVPSGKLLQTLPGHAIEWNADATRLAIAGEDHTVTLYDTKTGKVSATLKSDADSTISTAFSPDGKRIATADSDGAIRVWDVATGKLLLTLTGHKGAVEWVKWKPDGSQLLSKGADRTLRLWDARS